MKVSKKKKKITIAGKMIQNSLKGIKIATVFAKSHKRKIVGLNNKARREKKREREGGGRRTKNTREQVKKETSF